MGLQGQREDIQGREINGIKKRDVKDTKSKLYKQKSKEK